jgi:acetoin utilization deacetylase AcuC-like enzyme
MNVSTDSPTVFLYDDLYLKHDPGSFHPEAPGRLTAIQKRMELVDWGDRILLMSSRLADVEEVALVHDRGYIDLVERECVMGYSTLTTGDTSVCGESHMIARYAAGGVTAAVDAVLSGQAKNGFCAVRPPGHHASERRGMGFCLFNNIAIAARHAQKKHGLERILIADWDVHHGNGTQDIFYGDPTVFFMSTHQSPWYPGTGGRGETGAGKGEGFTMNRPFPAGAGNDEIISAFKNDLLPKARDFKPDLTLLSAGFDSRKNDPLGHFTIDDDGFRTLTKILLEIAHISGGGRFLSMLEGGYSPLGLASAVHAHIDELTRA